MNLGFAKDFDWYIMIFMIFWRIISVAIVQTYHVPDEYWQSLEVAHRLAFGYGYLTWEWREKIRSYICPFLISVIYKILAILRLDYTELLIYLPRIAQAIISGYSDHRFYVWTRNDFSVILQLFNWYWYYCATRTLTNSLESSLTVIALSVFPWKRRTIHGSKYLWLVGLMCIIRPTAAIIWIPLCIYHIISSNDSMLKLIKDYLSIGLCTLCYSIVIDSFCYGEFVFTPWRFFKINILTPIAGHYGVEPFHWYFTSALLVLLGPTVLSLPIAIPQVIKHRKLMPRQMVCLITIIWTLSIYSLLQHKEFRFILPLLPLIIYVSTCTVYPDIFTIPVSVKKYVVLLIISFNCIVALYFGMVHQKGTLNIMKHLRNEVHVNGQSNVDIMFMTPCHSTPFYSHLHINVPMRFLTCEPNFNNEENYQDETDQFFADPMKWINKNYNNSTVPRILIMYDNLVPRIKTFLDKHYYLVVELFDSQYPLPKRSGHIVMYKFIENEVM
ncbi:GPI mannosyltransferase 3 [Chelonus insularis]|uniref:GPI mannosyltransferase 3 n=1 Tax=Chelonus insularis TaxID=460826 RepID=UPI00158CD432|nr:GPI mannosyltransferase 3 [Chelonus insularis]